MFQNRDFWIGLAVGAVAGVFGYRFMQEREQQMAALQPAPAGEVPLEELQRQKEELEDLIAAQEAANEVSGPPLPLYRPSEKHDTTHNWGSPNHIKTQVEGQRLLDTGYHSGKQIYNITADRKIVKFQPDNTADNGYHAYEVTSPRDIPSSVLKKMRDDKVISNSEYTKFRKGKV